MRFHWGAIPKAKDFNLEGWNKLREPSTWIFQLLALPIGFVFALLFGYSWSVLTPLEPTLLSLPELLVFSLILVVAHETAHAATSPGFGLTPRTIIGFWPSRFLFYAHYEGEQSRNRFILVFLTPLILLSVIPLLFAVVTRIATSWVALASILNALFACGDILGAFIVFFQIPHDATVRNLGWTTYWKPKPGVIEYAK